MRVSIVDHRGALQAGDVPASRTVEVAGLADDVAADLAAVVLGLPPGWPAPGEGTHRTARPGGAVTVTLAADA